MAFSRLYPHVRVRTLSDDPSYENKKTNIPKNGTCGVNGYHQIPPVDAEPVTENAISTLNDSQEKTIPLSFGATCLAYWSLSKPRLSFAVALSSALAYYLTPNKSHWYRTTIVCIGVFGAATSASCFNQLLEVPQDAIMERTRDRALPTRRLTPKQVTTYGIITGIASVALMHKTCGNIPAILTAINIGLYAGIYTPLKMIHWSNTIVGSVVGAIPILIGWTSCEGCTLDRGAWTLTYWMFAWQFPHFFILDWRKKEEYRKAGYQMLSRSHKRTLPFTIFLTSLSLIPVSIAVPYCNITDWTFLFDSLALHGHLSYRAYRFYKTESSTDAKSLWIATLFYLCAIMGLLGVHHAIKVNFPSFDAFLRNIVCK
eukprot:TRINITY_DN5293_c0_g1_i2.p1 TRINITY_DN5293_c0_g1~~TRINITY_DN5293_c0_g1_i2.p1  ORF type:complete len:371 (-),score=21.48 TRINITY_DN5293_c0_g1_i2:36-1148(-)